MRCFPKIVSRLLEKHMLNASCACHAGNKLAVETGAATAPGELTGAAAACRDSSMAPTIDPHDNTFATKTTLHGSQHTSTKKHSISRASWKACDLYAFVDDFRRDFF